MSDEFDDQRLHPRRQPSQLGLFDLLLARDWPGFDSVILDFLAATKMIDVYRSVVMTIVAGHHQRLIESLRASHPQDAKARSSPKRYR